LVIQHVEPEGPFAIRDALERRDVDVDLRQVFAGAAVPGDASDLDGLVVMGGPMSATSDEGFPTRQAELRLIADSVTRGVPVLGICLGAQLLAAAAGGEVLAGQAGPEIGWGTVELTDAASSDELLGSLPADLGVLHWHGDTFSLPADAVRLAGNQRYANQAFRQGANAWGLQFHLEVDEDAVEAFLLAFGEEAHAAGTSPSAIADATPRAAEVLAPVRDLVADRFAGRVLAYSGAGLLVDQG
jgi:GMP synthase-like glutamine amidotransferase